MTKVNELKIENINFIRKYFYKEEILTKNQLHDLTGISLAACTNVLKELVDSKEIIQVDDASSTGGRKSKQYQLNPTYSYFLKLQVLKNKDSESVISSLCNLDGDDITRKEITNEQVTLKDILSVIKQYKKNQKIDCILISVPGICENGYMSICDCKCIEGHQLIEEIHSIWKIDVIIENDVNTAVIGMHGIYPNIENMALIYQPSKEYLGCGLIIHGQLYNGFQHRAGELRYLPDYSEKEQSKIQKKDPKAFLLNRIKIIEAVVSPEMIGWYSDFFDDEMESDNDIQIKHMKSLKDLIDKGLYEIGIHHILENGGNKYVR